MSDTNLLNKKKEDLIVADALRMAVLGTALTVVTKMVIESAPAAAKKTVNKFKTMRERRQTMKSLCHTEMV